jgi:MFS transporter, UMF1 family
MGSTLRLMCPAASFLPITLEQLARERGVLRDDKSTPCSAAWSTNPGGTPNATLFDPQKHKHNELPKCVVYVLGWEVMTESFAMYTFSTSVLVQALLIISMSAAADHGRYRKTFLLAFAFTGAVATALFIGVVPAVYLLGALLAIISNTCFGASFVLLNSFLPLLVRYHPSIERHRSERDIPEDDNDYEEHEDHVLTSSTSGLLPRESSASPTTAESPAELTSPELKLSTKLSSNGIGIGYLAGLFVQIVAVGLVVATGSTLFSLRLVLFLVGLWWFAFSIPAALWLRPRPGPPLPDELNSRYAWIAYVTYAWKALFKTIGHARKLKDIVIFLCAWFLLSDSIATVSG